MRKIISSLVIPVFVLASFVIPVNAQASKGCVTPQEFNRAKTGMSEKTIAKLFGTNGRVSAKSKSFGITVTMRDYKACTQFGAVAILFTNGKLETKTGLF
jgi:hypothetical protein